MAPHCQQEKNKIPHWTLEGQTLNSNTLHTALPYKHTMRSTQDPHSVWCTLSSPYLTYNVHNLMKTILSLCLDFHLFFFRQIFMVYFFSSRNFHRFWASRDEQDKHGLCFRSLELLFWKCYTEIKCVMMMEQQHVRSGKVL